MVILQDFPGTGKTTAMAFGMIAHCDENLDETQVLCVVPTFEAANELAVLIANLTKYCCITCNVACSIKKWNGMKTTIMIGTPQEITDLVKSSAISMSYINLICFDDADLTVGFQTVAETFFFPVQKKVLIVTTVLCKSIFAVVPKKAHVFKTLHNDLSQVPVKHLMLMTTNAEKIDLLRHIIASVRPASRVLVFCKVKIFYC